MTELSSKSVFTCEHFSIIQTEIEGSKQLTVEETCSSPMVLLPFKMKEEGVEIGFLPKNSIAWGDQLMLPRISVCPDTNAESIRDFLGVNVMNEDILPLGYCFGSEIVSSRYSIFGINSTDKEIEGIQWLGADDLVDLQDPILFVAIARFFRFLKDGMEQEEAKFSVTEG